MGSVVFANPRPEEPFGKNDQTHKMTTIHSPSKCLARVKKCHHIWLDQNFDPFLLTNKLWHVFTQRRKTETKPDTYSKDRMFVTSFAFCVITFEPIEVQTCSAPQNDCQNLVFVKDIKIVVEKMTRNRRKTIGKPADSLLCRLHSIQF